MPQIRCPNCGLTINLEKRKETDERIISDAVRAGATTFTELFHKTGLSRKTLSLRLKELCTSGVIEKTEGSYRFNGASTPSKSSAFRFGRASSILSDKRIRAAVMLTVLLIGLPGVSYVLAMLVSTPSSVPAYQQPQALGSFSAALEIENVIDLYAWQVIIKYNTDQLKVLNITLGKDFIVEDPGLQKSDLDNGELLLGATSRGEVSGFTGNGELVKIVFAYYVSDYEQPRIVEEYGSFETLFLDSTQSRIAVPNGALTLTMSK